jgi:hypothetical protein
LGKADIRTNRPDLKRFFRFLRESGPAQGRLTAGLTRADRRHGCGRGGEVSYLSLGLVYQARTFMTLLTRRTLLETFVALAASPALAQPSGPPAPNPFRYEDVVRRRATSPARPSRPPRRRCPSP